MRHFIQNKTLWVLCANIKQSLYAIFALTCTYLHNNIMRCLVPDTYCTAGIEQTPFLFLKLARWEFILFYFILFYFILFQGCICRIWMSLGQGSNQRCSCWPTPQPQQCRICAISATYATVKQQHWILHPLSKARDQMHIPMDTSQVLKPLWHNVNSNKLGMGISQMGITIS